MVCLDGREWFLALPRLLLQCCSHEPSDTLEHWLRVLVSQGAADLFLVSGFAPAFRLNGVVTPVSEAPLLGEDIEAALLQILHAQALERYRSDGSADV